MIAVKRQFRIWKHELLEAWGRISFYGRIVLGAALSIGLALVMVKQVLTPLNAELAELRSNLVVPENLDPETDEQIAMDKDRADNLRVSLKSWNKRLDQFRDHAVYLQPEAHLQVVSALQEILERCGLLLVSENLVVPEAESLSTRRGRSKPKVEPKPTDPLGMVTHRYEIQGGFRQIQAFLLLVEPLEWRFELHDLDLRPVEGFAGQLTFRFTLDIYYLKEKV